jgi:hypothetical protein
MSEAPCPVCNRPLIVAPEAVGSRDAYKAYCRVCGTYIISGTMDAELRGTSLYKDQRYLISAALREASDSDRVIVLTGPVLDQVLASVTPLESPFAAMDRILFYMLDRTKGPADYVQIFPHDYAIARGKNDNELEFYLQKLVELNRVEVANGARYRLTLDGWAYLDQLRQGRRKSDQAFVAMWFDASTKEAWTDGFEPALRTVGYSPIRIDLVEHADKIDDRIVAEIRRSGLVVADFTGHRGGVYFEAGFALGLGKALIWTCRSDAIGDAHFDTRQYNHLLWDDPADLRSKLEARLRAVYPYQNT